MEPKVLPLHDPFVGRILRDFRLREAGRVIVARIRGEGKFQSAVFPEPRGERSVLVEFVPEAEWKASLPPLAKRWLIALRLPYLVFSLLPLLLVLATYHQQSRPAIPGLSTLLFACVALLHLSCNLWNDYEDHLRGVDSPDSSGGSGVIQKLWIPARQLRNAAAALFVAGFLLGIALFLKLPFQSAGVHVLWIGLLGAAGAASYSGWPFHYKYFALGEPVIFLVSGPLLTMGASIVFFRDSSYFLWFALVSLPLSLLATLRLHTGNMRRIPFDAMAGTTTIARKLGFRGSKALHAFLLFAPFFTVGCLALLQVTGKAAVFSFLAAPLALLTLRPLLAAKGPLDPAWTEIRARVSCFHFVFGLIYCISFLFP